jgi:hypothetical protein
MVAPSRHLHNAMVQWDQYDLTLPNKRFWHSEFSFSLGYLIGAHSISKRVIWLTSSSWPCSLLEAHKIAEEAQNIRRDSQVKIITPDNSYLRSLLSKCTQHCSSIRLWSHRPSISPESQELRYLAKLSQVPRAEKNVHPKSYLSSINAYPLTSSWISLRFYHLPRWLWINHEIRPLPGTESDDEKSNYAGAS